MDTIFLRLNEQIAYKGSLLGQLVCGVPRIKNCSTTKEM